jgi:hypothetical protein
MNTAVRWTGTIALSCFAAQLLAAEGSPRADVEQYFAANRLQEPALLQKAFHPTAMVYWHDPQFGVRGLTQYGWRARMSAGAPRTELSQQIHDVDHVGDAAVVTATGKRNGKPLTDFLLLLRLDSGWRIVGKVFANEPLTSGGNAAAYEPIRALLERKQAGDAEWDGAKLASTMHRRAMLLNLDAGELVSASALEWAARYDERRQQPPSMRPVEYRVEQIRAAGDVAYARWTIRWSDGSVWTDFALLIQEKGSWSIVNLAFVPGRW